MANTDTRNIDFAAKYEKKLDQIFSENSLTERYVTKATQFTDDGGVASAYFRTVDTSDFLEQHTGPVFGTPNALKSSVVRKDLELFYKVNEVIPNVDINDTAGALTDAGEILQTGIREQYAPLIDKIRIATAIKAANTYGGVNVVTATTSIMKDIDSMIAALKNVRSYAKTQALFIPASVESELDESLFTIYAPNKNDSLIESGIIGKYKGVEVISLPDELFNTMALDGEAPYAKAKFTAAPEIKAILWDKRVMKDVRKLYKTYVLTGKEAVAAGVDGALLRGLFRPGTWVVDANGTKKAVAIVKKSQSSTQDNTQTAAFSAPTVNEPIANNAPATNDEPTVNEPEE